MYLLRGFLAIVATIHYIRLSLGGHVSRVTCLNTASVSSSATVERNGLEVGKEEADQMRKPEFSRQHSRMLHSAMWKDIKNKNSSKLDDTYLNIG